ncbi:MAG: 4Fe-4S dicluster domain-containing protein [Lachnospirales bacterium]
MEIASKCINCNKCINDCSFLQEYFKSILEFFYDFLEEEEIDSLIPYSCTLCDHCKEICPEKIELSHFFFSIRKDFAYNNNGKSPVKSRGGVNMHQELGFSKFFCTKKGGKDE